MKKNTLSNEVFGSFLSELDEVFTPAAKYGWLETPVSFRVFVESVEHMGLPPLSERQYEVADFMLGNDSKDIFDNRNTIACLLWGKGSGKDMLASIIILYIVHCLLCLESPQRFLGLLEGEAIDILNVAANADQATTVFFDKLRQRVIRWKWLRDHYPVKISGIFLGQIKPEDFFNTVVITKNGILFPKNVRAFSGHSQEASQEGKNILAFCLDESSAFDETPMTSRAQKIFDMLKSSAVSRFGERYKGFVLSFPRYKDDFTMRLLSLSERELHWYSDKGATWDIKPASLFKDYPEKYFEFEGHKIPLEYETEFRLNPTDAKGKYLVDPPEVEQAFMEYPEKIDACVDGGRPAIARVEDYIDGNTVKKRFVYWNTDNVYRDYIITVDLGLKSDSAALSVFHCEVGTEGNRIIQDLVTAWVPDKEKQLVVSLTDIEEFIITLSKHIHIVGVWFDQWNSALLSQRLSAAGLFSEIYNLTFQDYKNFKDRIYSNVLHLLHNKQQLTEMKRLVLLRGGKVDHPVNGSKDCTDTVVGAIKLLVDGKGVSSVVPSPLGGEMITGSNLSSQGGTFI